MDYCSNCGAKLPEGADFCTVCGAKTVRQAVPVHQMPYQGQVPRQEMGTQQRTGPQYGWGQPPYGTQVAAGMGQQPPKKKNTAAKIVLAVLCVAVLAVAAVILIPKLTGDKETHTTEAAQQTTPAETTEQAADGPADAWMQALAGQLPALRQICSDGAKIAGTLAEATKTVYDVYRSGENAGTALGTYVPELEAQNRALDALQADLAAVKKALEAAPAPAGETGRAVQRQTEALLLQIGSAADDMLALSDFYIRQLELYLDHYGFMNDYEDDDYSNEYLEAFYGAVKGLQDDYRKMDKPALVARIWDMNTDQLTLLAQSLYYFYSGRNEVTLELYNFAELSDYYYTLDNKYNMQALDAMYNAFEMDRGLFSGIFSQTLQAAETACGGGAFDVSAGSASESFHAVYEIAGEVYPNTYAGLDSVVNLTFSTTREKQDVLIETEVVGFTQPQEQKVTLTQQPQYLMIKPPVLIDLPDLSSSRTTTLRLKITDNETGTVLVQESRQLTLYSLYDVFYTTNEFGVTAQFNLLGWMRPESEAVSVIKQTATRYLESLNSSWGILPGYQNGYGVSEEITTKLQVAAVQKAISELGVRYTNDAYSYAAHQHVLTPDQVLAQKSGICIETSLLMASCLQSMTLHPMIVLTPGHCQVAVETWSGSRQYYLIETTDLPYGGITIANNTIDWNGLFVNPADPSDAFWTDYLSGKDGEESFDGSDVFVIDCDLRTLMNLQGLESVQAELDIKAVEFDGGDLPDEEVEHGEPGYVTVSNNNGTFTVMAKDTATYSVFDNSVVISPLGTDDWPLLTVVRYQGTGTASDYLNAWYRANIEGNSRIAAFDGQIYSSEIYGETYYYIFYTETDEDDPSVTLYRTVYVRTLPDGLAVFAATEDVAESDETENVFYEGLGIAMSTFAPAG